MATLQLTQVYIEREQKKALQARATAHGTKVAEEVRRAVGAYLAGVTPEELGVLNGQVHDPDRRLVQMETVAEVAKAQRDVPRKLPKRGG